jgi:hypothetical protein
MLTELSNLLCDNRFLFLDLSNEKNEPYFYIFPIIEFSLTYSLEHSQPIQLVLWINLLLYLEHYYLKSQMLLKAFSYYLFYIKEKMTCYSDIGELGILVKEGEIHRKYRVYGLHPKWRSIGLPLRLFSFPCLQNLVSTFQILICFCKWIFLLGKTISDS